MSKVNLQENGDHFDSETEELNCSSWVKTGFTMTRRNALCLTDPNHLYNYSKKLLENTKFSPLDFGIRNPKSERFDNFSKNQLIDQILELEEENFQLHRHLS